MDYAEVHWNVRITKRHLIISFSEPLFVGTKVRIFELQLLVIRTFIIKRKTVSPRDPNFSSDNER